MKKFQLTKEGYEKIQAEYQDLIKNKRPYAVERLQKARGMGDLSENSEYTAAKDALALVEGRIQEIEEILKYVEIVKNHNNGAVVDVGSKITVDVNGQTEQFELVGEFEADPSQKKLSQTSPIGKALLGKKIGEAVEISVPAGKINYRIVDIK